MRKNSLNTVKTENKSLYILNIEFLGSQDIRYNLLKFYGLSFASISLLLKEIGVSSQFKIFFKDLNEDKLLRLKNIITEKFVVEADLVREMSKNIDRLKSVNCYKKLRFKLKLPVNGQRTSTNSRTCRRKSV